MAVDAQLRALARKRIRRRQAIEEKIRQRPLGLVETYLRIETEELRRQRLARLGTWSPSIGLPWPLRFPDQPRNAAVRVPVTRHHVPWGLVRNVMLAGVVLAAPIMTLAWAQSSAALQKLDRAIACAATTTLVDASGRLVGAIPVLNVVDCDGHRFMVTAPFSPETTETLATAISAIEGEYSVNSSYVWFGHDVRGFARKLGQLLGFLPGRGFSSPLLTSVEAVMGEHDIGLWRKLVLFLATSRFAAESLPDDASRARFITMYMPSIQGAGYPRAGILGAHMLFGGREPQTTAEFCQLARASGFPIRAIGDSVTGRFARTWAQSIGPGAAACVRALSLTPEVEAEAMTDLRAACGGTDLCLSPPAATTEMDRDRLEAAWIDIARDRLPRFAPLTPAGNTRFVALDLLRLSGADLGGIRQTTLDTELQSAIDRAVEPALGQVGRRLPTDVCLTGQCAHRVDHTIILGEVIGRAVAIRALHVNRHGALTGFPIYDPQTRRWEAAPPRFGLGSTSKVMILLAAVQHRINRVCSNSAGGATCMGGRWLSLRKAMARSDSDAMQWIAARYPTEIAAMQAQMGAQDNSVAFSAFDAAFGIGRSAMTSAQAMALFGAILGEGHGTVRFFDRAVSEVDLGAAGIDAQALATARRVLDAPMVDGGGTLTSVGSLLRAQGLTPLVAKSGTHTEQGVNLVRTSTVAFAMPDGRRFILHVALAATNTINGLGRLSHEDLVAIQRAVIDTLTSR